MGRKEFKDFVEIRNLRNGAWIDNKMVSVKFDLRIGPFYIFDIGWHVKSGSLRFPCTKQLKVQRPYLQTIRELAIEAVKAMRQQREEQP